MWSPDCTCVTLFLPLRPDIVSLQVRCRRTDEMEVISPQPMLHEVCDFCFSVSRSHLTNRGMGPSPSVFCFVLRPPTNLSSLSAGAGLDGHVGVNFEHWVPGFILVEHSEGAHLFWDATGLRNAGDDAHGSDYALDGGVVGRPHDLGHGKSTRASTVEGIKGFGCYDPLAPANVGKIHPEVPPGAASVLVVSSPLPPPRFTHCLFIKTQDRRLRVRTSLVLFPIPSLIPPLMLPSIMAVLEFCHS